jgi:hypothetical protein
MKILSREYLFHMAAQIILMSNNAFMRVLLLSIIILIATSQLSAQFNEIDEKKELAGIRLLSAPDYSMLNFYKPGVNSNMYTVNGKNPWSFGRYQFKNIIVSVKKGRIAEFTCIIDNKDSLAIKTELGKFFKPAYSSEYSSYFRGANLEYILQRNRKETYLKIKTMLTDTIPDVKPRNNIADLIGKKMDDPLLKQFIESIPGKYEKENSKTEGNIITWKNNGIKMNFFGSKKDLELTSITFFFKPDTYHKIETPFTGGHPLPFDFTADTNPYQTIDLLGYSDAPGAFYYVTSFKKYKLRCEFDLDRSKPAEKNKLKTISISSIY